MNRILALALSATIVLSLAACASAKASNDGGKVDEPAAIEEIGGMTAGGWNQSASPALTDEQRAVLAKALEGFAGSSITPVAYLGSQVVAGTNHCFLCQATVTYPGAQPKYVLVYVYEALDGGATLMNIADLDIGSFCEYGGDANDNVGGESVQIANPFVDYASLDAAAKAAGFELTAPDAVEGWNGEKLVQVMSGSMIQIIFRDGDDNRLFIRKEAGSEDISGDYNEYGEVNAVAAGAYEATFKGDDGKVSTAVWTNGGYSYAVTSDVPMSLDAMRALVAQIA